jgi:AcrR family transcriptional regulator
LDVKTTILQAGTSLLKEHGIAALTQLKVAKLAGVKQSHLTYYFPKRSDLLLGIATHAIDELMSTLAVRLGKAPPQTAFVEIIGAAMINGIPPKIMIGLIVAADEEPALRIPLRRLVKSVRRRIQGMLETADVPDSGNVALLLHATIVGLAIMNHAQQTQASAKDAKNGIAGIVRLLGVGTASRLRGGNQ